MTISTLDILLSQFGASSMSGSNYCFLTYIQISQETSQVVWYSHLLQNFPVCCDTHSQWRNSRCFSGIPCFFYDPMDVGNLISDSSAFSKATLNIWKFSVHILLKLHLKNFEHSFASKWNECNCVVVWTFFGISLLWDWNENWPFPVLWPLLSFPNLLAYWRQHFRIIIL